MTDDDSRGREYGRFAFVAACVLALVLAATLLPTITAAFDRGPLESLLSPADVGPGGGDGAGGAELGSLDPASETAVGSLDGTSKSLRSLGPSVHFTVESAAPSYWRTGAYGTYTGAGWRQSQEFRRLQGSLAPPPRPEETVSYRVRLNRTARALPTVWRPREVSLSDAVSTGSGAIRSERPLGPGRTFEGVSTRPARDPGVLATAGTDYPEDIADRYTQLPGDTPDRLSAFTDRLTADAGSPYEAATRIEQFLETNKSYSLNVSAPGTDHVADTFVFEMDRGYCEYFATSMTAMLRSQDIPARYVVGYSTGQRTDERTYTVRGMNAHAWVEVYFPDTGWVRFDPTPGEARLAAERRALQRQRPDAPPYDHSETGSPGESFAASDPSSEEPSSDAPSTPTPPTPTTTPGDGSPTPTPGGDTPTDGTPTPTVTTTPESPDGPVGNRTGNESAPGDGNATGTGYEIALSEPPVPGGEVTVTVTIAGVPVEGATVLFGETPVGTTGPNGTVTARVPYVERLSVTAVPPGVDGRAALAGPPDGRLFAPEDGTVTVERTFETETNATLSVGGTVATGRSVLVTAAVRGTPVPNATVRLDGARVGRTDAAGRLSVALPDEPGNVTLSVARDPVRGTRTLRLRELTLTAEPTLPLALPLTGVEVRARWGEQPATGVPVTLDGERVGRTDVDGTVTTTLPLSGRASLAVSADGQRATATVGGLWTNLLLSAGSLALVAGGLVVAGRRRDGDLRRRITAALDAAVVTVVGWLIRAADLLLAAAGTLADRLGGVVAGRLTPGELLADLRAWLAARRPGGASPDTGTGDGPTEHEVRLAWRRLLARTSIDEPATRTPGEIATHAVEQDGLPAEHVATLRDAFRAVEYGAFDPSSWAGAVETAAAAIDGGDEP